MSDDKKKVTETKLSDRLQLENQMIPEVCGINANLVTDSNTASSTRIYMAGGNFAKSVVAKGNSGRRIIQGFEYQYGEKARKIVAPANMTVEKIFHYPSLVKGENLTDKWNPLYVIFKNDETNQYDLLTMPKYHSQNTYLGFEFKYDRKLMSKLKEGATFPKDTVFAKSPRVSDTGEWCFTMDLKVCAISDVGTEEDGIIVSRSCARDKLATLFIHDRSFQWHEDECIPLMLYGTDEDPKPFPEPGDKIREDGVVMAFRRRNSRSALVSLTRKALREVDWVSDIVFVAPPASEVASVEVISERLKDRSHNRSTNYIQQSHNKLLDTYERAQSQMWNDVCKWYNQKIAQNGGNDIPISFELDTFLRKALVSYTVTPHGTINPISRSIKRIKLKHWMINITLKEEVSGRVKWKMTGIQGDKAVIVQVREDEDMYRYPDGTVADIVVNNTPAFRRQIYSMLITHSVNFISNAVHKEAKALHAQKKYMAAYETVYKFIATGFPEFAEIIDEQILDDQAKIEFINHVVNDKIVVHRPNNHKLVGVELIKALRSVYSYKPDKVTFTNSLGEKVTSKRPVLITNADMILLDKMGTDMSSVGLPARNLFGFPAGLNETTKHSSYIRQVGNRNTGETEGRLRISQSGPEDIVKNLSLGFSPENANLACQRIIRANDPFDIDQIIKPEEYRNNRATLLADQMLSDAGYTLRRERPSDIVK